MVVNRIFRCALLLLVFGLLFGCDSVYLEENRLDRFVQIFDEYCRSSVRERPKFFSRRVLVYRLGTILEESDEQEILKDSLIAKDMINVCDQIIRVDSYSIIESIDGYVLTIKYFGEDEESKVLSLSFLEADGDWLIDEVNEGVVKL